MASQRGSLQDAATSREAAVDGADTAHLVEAAPRQLLGLVGLAVLAAAYWIVRSGGQWADNDSSFMATAIRSIATDAHLVPPAPQVYANGYGYQAFSTALIAFTGIKVSELEQLVYPLLAAFVVVPTWVLYRELLGTVRTATLSALLLLIVPGYLFTLLRGSHEPFDRVFALTMLWLVVRASRRRGEPWVTAVHVGVALAMAYAFIATNDLLGISFVGAMATALVGAWVLQRGPVGVREMARETVRLLRWISAAGVLLFGVFAFFVYEPAGHSLRQLFSLPTGIAESVLPGTDTPDTSPYAGILAGWVTPEIYVLLSMAEYLLIAGSAIVWVWQGWSWLRGGRPRSFGAWLLWLLYAAFSIQLGLAILSDRSGAIANNLEYRSFTVFATFAAPMLVQGLLALRLLSWPKPVLRLGLATFTVAALLKATNDPFVSNRWTFYTSSELAALMWADANQRSTVTWLGPDERLRSAFRMNVEDPSQSNDWHFKAPSNTDRAYLVSDVVQLDTARLGLPLPVLGPDNIVYDNGTAQLYRTRAVAAFER